MFSDFTDDSVSILSILKLTGYDWSPMQMTLCIRSHGVNLYIPSLPLTQRESESVPYLYVLLLRLDRQYFHCCGFSTEV